MIKVGDKFIWKGKELLCIKVTEYENKKGLIRQIWAHFNGDYLQHSAEENCIKVEDYIIL